MQFQGMFTDMDITLLSIANRDAWDVSAGYHRGSAEWNQLISRVADPTFSCLDMTVTSILNTIGIAGKSVAHVCCNNGSELISVKKMGAQECVGFDISKAFLDQASELAAVAQQEISFVECDANDLPKAYHGHFDLVIITIGTLGWFRSLDRFFASIQGILRSGGTICIYEMHPVLEMFEPDASETPRIVHDYFREEPYVITKAITYDGFQQDGSPAYWHFHTLSEIISRLFDHGFSLTLFREFPHNIAEADWQPFEGKGLPMCYAMVANTQA
jgi:ubiquinone/menaquinone biosynthesis C-methylase UbiE